MVLAIVITFTLVGCVMSSSPLPCNQGRGVGGEGLSIPHKTFSHGSTLVFDPSPLPVSPDYRGEGKLAI